MAKKVIRLTEADIENIVRKIIQEQSEDNDTIIMPRPDMMGGLFKIVNKSKLYWCENRNKPNECTQIWEKGADVEWSYNDKVLKPSGWVNKQLELGGGYNPPVANYNDLLAGNSDFLPVQRNWNEFNTVNWTRLSGDSKKVYFWALDTKSGLPMLNVTVIIAATRKQLKNTSWLSSANAGDNRLTLSNNKIIWGKTTIKYNKDFYFVCAQGFGATVRPGGNTPPTPPPPVVDKLELSLMDMFKFDETEFTNKVDAESKINEFISKLKDYSDKFEEFKQHIIDSKPVVYGYASRDQDPSENITGKFVPCKSEPTRGEYNLCLSQHRADKVTEMINTGLDGTGMNIFTGKGMGETDKFAPGKKWPEVTDNTQTAPNRRVHTSIPPFNYTVTP